MSKQHGSNNILFTLALLVLFLGFLAGIMIWQDRQQQSALPVETTQTQIVQTAATDDAQYTTTPPETTVPAKPRRINFLLIGRDWHDEGENGRSDAMILCSVDTGAKTVTLTSFLRDIYLKIPGHGSSRLNAAYSWGGAVLLKQTLEENFGVVADVSLEIDFEGFETMIDHLGGVEIGLTDREADYLNRNYGWNLVEGTAHLDGAQALAYSRIRFLDSDFVRTERQRNVLMALMEQYRSATLQEMLRVTDAFLDQSTSDHTDEELVAYALELHAMMKDCTVRTHRVPADGTYSYETIRGMSVIQVDFEENRSILEELLGPDEE